MVINVSKVHADLNKRLVVHVVKGCAKDVDVAKRGLELHILCRVTKELSN